MAAVAMATIVNLHHEYGGKCSKVDEVVYQTEKNPVTALVM